MREFREEQWEKDADGNRVPHTFNKEEGKTNPGSAPSVENVKFERIKQKQSVWVRKLMLCGLPNQAYELSSMST